MQGMKKYVLAASILALILVFSAFQERLPLEVSPESPLSEILLELGDEPLPHPVNTTIPGVSVEKGREIVHLGRTSGSPAVQSRHFVCTSCHNPMREDPDLAVSDPQARLEYVVDQGMPFLQGTALYGAVNRTSFYNGDYDKKYGELVEPAREDIREAIRLCAVECAQGRPMADWEVESVLAYLWDIQLRLGDLILSEAEYEQIRMAVRTGRNAAGMIDLLHSKYLTASPATFLTPPENRKKGYEEVEAGDPANGKLIYDHSCLHCHDGQRFAFFDLSEGTASFKYLKKHFPKYTRYSTYQVVRYGTSPMPGKRAYMPNYPMEKMSNQQMEDLRAYIEQQAK